MFADVANVEIQAGRGGDGKLSFRHEKYRARGGPDGGNGGRGGDVVILVDHNTNTLSQYRTQRLIKAASGMPGGTNRRYGKSGEDSVIAVPVGTVVTDGNGDVLADLVEEGQSAVIARGGRGGFGNAHFASSTRQSPRLSEPGEPGEQLIVTLELKLVADVGLIGLPNAGKSTLLSVITNARPHIADYPFTTLTPNLGVSTHRRQEFVVADIPGLIEGASVGKGLGDEFLRHIERTAVLLHLVSADTEDVAGSWQQVRNELAAYSEVLRDKPTLAILSQIDRLEPKVIKERLKELEHASGTQTFAISAQTHKGLPELLDATLKLVKAAREQAAAEIPDVPIITLANLPDVWQVEQEDGGWRVTGGRIESFARRTNPDQPDALERLQDILNKTGVAKELRRRGAQAGDKVRVGAIEVEWHG